MLTITRIDPKDEKELKAQQKEEDIRLYKCFSDTVLKIIEFSKNDPNREHLDELPIEEFCKNLEDTAGCITGNKERVASIVSVMLDGIRSLSAEMGYLESSKTNSIIR